jgi:hypothetical protein
MMAVVEGPCPGPASAGTMHPHNQGPLSCAVLLQTAFLHFNLALLADYSLSLHHRSVLQSRLSVGQASSGKFANVPGHCQLFGCFHIALASLLQCMALPSTWHSCALHDGSGDRRSSGGHCCLTCNVQHCPPLDGNCECGDFDTALL